MIANIIAGLLSGIIGAMGFGGGGILILYLALYKDLPQLNAQGINLIFFIPCAVLALIMHKKNKLIDTKIAVKYILLGLVGVAVGFFLMKIIDEKIIKYIFSSLLIFMGVKELFSKKKN